MTTITDELESTGVRRNVRLWVLLLGLVALLAGAATAVVTSGGGDPGAKLAQRLAGRPSLSPPVVHPRADVTIGVGAGGLELRNRRDPVTLSLQDARSGAWSRRATGASRPLSIGTEVVRFGLPASEEYVVVDRHLGTRTLKWRLNPGIRPVVQGNSVALIGPRGLTNLTLSPARFFDLTGRDRTPAGTHWTAEKVGASWQLALHVNDSGVPTPYVIDPVVTFRAIATSQANAATTASVALPASVAAGDLLVATMSINTTSSSNFVLGGTAGACSGGGTKVDETRAAANITQAIWYGVAVAGDAGKTCTVTWTGAGEIVMTVVDYTTGTYYPAQPIDFGAIGSAGTTTSATFTSNNLSTFFYNEFLALIATEDKNKQPAAPTPGTWTEQAAGNTYINPSGSIKIGVDYFDGATRATAGSGTVTGTAQLANNTIAAVLGIRQSDVTAPTVTLTAPTASAKIRNGFSLTGTVTDEAGGSGPQKIEYYYCVGNVTCNATTGSPTLIGSSTTSTTYPVTWSTMPADGTYTVFAKGFDNAGNFTSSSSVVVTLDNSGPTLAITAPANNSSQSTVTSVTGTASDASGVAGVTVKVSLHGNANGYWNGTTFTGTAATATVFTATTGNGYATWSANTSTVTWTAGNQYDVIATATDSASPSGNTSTATNMFAKPGAANAAQSTLAPTVASVTANGVATQVLTVQAKDAGGNNLVAGGSTVVISKQSGTGSIGAVTDNGNGTYTATVTAPTASGSGVFVATLGGAAVQSGGGSQTQATVSYVPGPANAAKSTLTPTAATITANGSATQTLTVQAKDANNNNLTAGGATVTIGKQSGTGTIGAVTDNGNGTYTATVTAPTATGSGVFVATLGGSAVQSGGASQTQATITYTAGPASKLGFDPSFQPANAQSGASTGTIKVQVQDANGNLVSGDTSSVTLALTSAGGATLSGTKTVAAVAGVATFSGLSIDKTGSYTLTATDGALTNGTSTSFTISPGAANPTQSTLTPTSASLTADGAATQTLTVQAKDANNNNLTTGGATVTITKSAGSGTISAVTDNGNGTYTATVTAPTTTGSGSFTATLAASPVKSGTASQTTTTLTYTPGPANATQSTVGATSPVVADGSSTATITVTVRDQFGNAVPGATVTLDQGSGHSSPAAVSGATDGSGVFTTTATDSTIETVTYTASVGATALGSTAVSFQEGAVDASASTATSSPASIVADGSMTSTLTVTAKDAFGHLLAGQSITITQNGGSTIARASGSTNGSGVFTTTVKSSVVQTVTYTVTVGAAQLLAQPQVTFTPNTASKLVFDPSFQPQSAQAGSSLGTIKVAVEDSNGNLVTTNTSNVTLALTTPAGATLSGTATVAAVAGIATFSGLSADKAGTYTLTATDGALTTATSTSFTISPGLAATLVFDPSFQPQSAQAGSSLGTIKVEVEDTNGNLVTTATSNVTLALTTPGGATLSGTATVAAVAGIATFSGLSVDRAGGYTLTAGGSALTTDTSTSFTITPGPATRLAVTGSGSQIAGTSQTLTLTAYDAQGNVATAYTSFHQITFAGAGSTTNPSHSPEVDGTTLGLPTTLLFSNGSATATLALYKQENAVVTAADGASAIPASSGGDRLTVAVAAAPASRLALAGTPAQTAGATQDVTLTALDPYGNVDTTYAGSHTLRFSGAASSTDPVTQPAADGTAFGADTPVAFTSGSATASVRLYRAESAVLAAADGMTGMAASTGGDALAVVVSPASTSRFAVTSTAATPQTAGGAFDLTVTAEDAYGNTTTGYSGTVHVTSSDPLAALPSDTILTGGTKTFAAGVTLETAGAQTVTVTDGSVAGQASVTVQAASAATLRLSGSANQTAGASQALTIRAYDQYGNLATGYSGDKSLTFGGASASPAPATQPTVSAKTGAAVAFGTPTTVTFAGGVATAGGTLRLYAAENATVTATDGSIAAVGGDALAVAVSPAALGAFAFQLASPQTNGVAFTGTDTLTAVDPFGNAVTTFNALVDPVTVTANGSLTGAIGGLTSGNVLNGAGDFTNGVATLTGALTYTGASGTGTFTAAAQSGSTGTSGSVTVSPGAAVKLVVTGGSAQTAGQSQSITVTAEDVSGNTATGYTGAKSLTFSGAASVGSFAPKVASTAFGAATPVTFGAGTATASLTLYKSETAQVTATDGGVTATGADRLQVSVSPAAAAASASAISATPGTVTADGSSAAVVTVHANDAYGNAQATGGAAVVLNATRGTVGAVTDNGDGTYSASIASTSAGGSAISGTLDGSAIGTGANVTFTPGAVSPARSTLTPVTSSIAADGSATRVLTVQAKDANGNDLTTGGSTVTITKLSGTGTIGGVTDLGNGRYQATVTSPAAVGSGVFVATVDAQPVQNAAASQTQATVSYLAGNPTHLAVTSVPGSAVAGGDFSVTVEAQDVNGNAAVVPQDTDVTLTLASHDGGGAAGALTGETATIAAGTSAVTFTGVEYTKAENITLTAARTAGDALATSAPSPSIAVGPAAGSGDASTLTPTSATLTADGSSQQVLTVQVEDAFGNTATSSGDTVTIAKQSGTGSISSAAYAGNGRYTATVTAPATAGSGAFVASVNGTPVKSGGASQTQSSIAYVPGPADASQSTLTPGTANLTVGGSTQVLTVQVKDAHGNDVTTGGNTVTITKQSGTGSIGSVTYAGSGRYTATVTSPSLAGSGVFVATVDAQPVPASSTITYLPGGANASQSTLAPAAASITADGVSTQALTVQVRDANGNPLTTNSTTVAIAKQSGTGSIGPVSYTGGGQYTATVTAPTQTGSGDFAATVGGQSVPGTATVAYAPGAVDAGHSSVVATNGTPSTDSAGTTVTVTVRDAHDNPIANVPVTLTPDSGSSTILPAIQPVNTGASGTASFAVADDVAQTVVYSASAGITSVTQTAAVQFQPGAPAQAAFTAQPTNAVAGAAIAPAPVVRILDQHGNLTASSENVSLAITGGTGPAGASLSGTTTVAAAGGVATFADVKIAKAGTGYRLTATTSSSGLTVDSATFDIAVGPASAAHSTITAAPGQINNDGSSGNVTVTVHAKDAYDNALGASGGVVTLSTNLGSLGTVTDNGDGTYTATLTPTGTSGTATITGTLGGQPIGTNATVQIVDPVPVSAIDSGPSGAVGSASATFTFHSPNAAGSATFACSLDGAAFTACSSPKSYTFLADGAHTFKVHGQNANGTGPDVARSWTADTTGPTVSLTSTPGAYTNNPVEPLAAAAADATTSVGSVEFFFSLHSTPCASGTAVATDTTAPYDASWTTPSDGAYDLCGVATDAVGNTTTSALATTTVDRTAPVATLTAPAANVRQTITLHATGVADATAGVQSVVFERSPHGLNTWTPIGAGAAQGGGAYDAAFDTTVPGDGVYDLRVLVTDKAGNAGSDTVGSIRVDNTPPSTGVDTPLPNADVRGTIALAATSSDAGSGVASTTFEISAHGLGAWSPVNASFDTTTKTDGAYDIRSVATDNSGNLTRSAAVQVTIDNTPPTAVLAAVPPYVRGAITLDSTGTADGGSGLQSQAFQISDHGANSWTTIASPLDTSTQSDGSYDLRVHAVDNAGNSADSPVRTTVMDNTAPSVVTLDAPASGTTVRGTIALSTTEQDATAGVNTGASTIRIAPAGTIGLNPCDTFGTAVALAYDTHAVADGHYDVWAAAVDNAGNGRCSVTPHDILVDNTAPVTTDDAPFGAQNHDVTVTLSPSDNLTGVAATHYRIDGGAWQTGTSILVAASLGDGAHALEYYSTDGAGNDEAIKTASVTIDTTAPGGSASDPGNILSGTVQLSASPTEPDIASVTWQFRPHGSLGAYTTIGTDTSGPWTMSWITTGPTTPDGQYDVQAVFTDTIGNANAQAFSTKTIDNTAPSSATVTAPTAASVRGGTILLASSASDATTSIDNARTTYEIKAAGDGAFAPVSGPSWDSTGKPDGPAAVRVAVWDFAGNGPTYSAPVGFTIDNTAPAVTLSAPPAATGTVDLTASGSADIDHVAYDVSPHGLGSWSPVGTAAGPPFTQVWNTTGLTDGTYDVRATATDLGAHTGADTRTVVVDHTPPTATLIAPAAGASVGGTAVGLTATAGDASGSGVASVRFQYRLHGSGDPFVDAASDATAPYGATWDVTGLSDGQYDLQLVVADAAGNTTVAGSRVVAVDTTPPSLSAFTVTSPQSGTFPLKVSTSGDTTRVTYAMRPAGGGSWSTIGSATTGAAFTLAFDSTTVSDGVYDFQASAEDQFGNTVARVAPGVAVDNTAPAITSSAPADGDVVPSLDTITATVSETLASIDGLKLDGAGAAFTPTIAGTNVTFPVGTVAEGNHALTGRLVDGTGNARPFRINFTVQSGTPANPPATSKNVSATQPTTLSTVDSTATVTVPGDVWQQPKPDLQDWLVLKIEPIPATSPAVAPPPVSAGATFSYAESVVDVRMFWNLAGTDEHSFDAPIEIELTDPTGTGTPATNESGAWRAIGACADSGVLPADSPDCYWRTGGIVHILTRHLTMFAILNGFTTAMLVPPRDFAAVVAADGLTLRWAPGIPVEQVRTYTLYADGTPVGSYGATQYEQKLGQITSDDPRRFWLTETDLSGAESGRTPVVRAVPSVVGLTVSAARDALAARTFTVGRLIATYAPQAAPGTVVGPTGVSVEQEGSSIDLLVASGSVVRAPLDLSVASAPRVRMTRRTLVGRILLTQRSRVDVTLDAKPYLRVQRWHFLHVKPGATVLRLKLRHALRTGTYRLYWKATTDPSREVQRRITPLAVIAPFARAHAASPAQVVVVSDASRSTQAVPSTPNGTVRKLSSEETYLFATYHDVSVIVLDMDAHALPFLESLRTVFPTTRVIAISTRSAVRAAAARDGAVAVPPSPPSKLASLVALLLRKR